MAENEVQGGDARPSFGEELRKEREIRGITLREIAEATKVSQRLLDALERNDHRNLPAPVFTRGFVREYARYLGLDGDEMVTRYIHYTKSIDDPALHDAPEPMHSSRVTGEIPRPYARVDRNVWIFLILLLVFLGVVFGVRFWMKRSAAAVETPPVATGSMERPASRYDGSPPAGTPV